MIIAYVIELNTIEKGIMVIEGKSGWFLIFRYQTVQITIRFTGNTIEKSKKNLVTLVRMSQKPLHLRRVPRLSSTGILVWSQISFIHLGFFNDTYDVGLTTRHGMDTINWINPHFKHQAIPVNNHTVLEEIDLILSLFTWKKKWRKIERILNYWLPFCIQITIPFCRKHGWNRVRLVEKSSCILDSMTRRQRVPSSFFRYLRAVSGSRSSVVVCFCYVFFNDTFAVGLTTTHRMDIINWVNPDFKHRAWPDKLSYSFMGNRLKIEFVRL